MANLENTLVGPLFALDLVIQGFQSRLPHNLGVDQAGTFLPVIYTTCMFNESLRRNGLGDEPYEYFTPIFTTLGGIGVEIIQKYFPSTGCYDKKDIFAAIFAGFVSLVLGKTSKILQKTKQVKDIKYSEN